ncbi:hypothetical protein CLOM_g11778 [Closterium sp. NIES-68]|nr:hypothetical protein CLOM_g11778 [Closterium sp. NIES-68]GJP82130.1 hypothetical protein CLOP_g12347 [Closterium sp. NIES-67]
MAAVQALVLTHTNLAIATPSLRRQEQVPRRLAITASKRHRRPGVHHRGPALEKATFPHGYGVAPETALQNAMAAKPEEAKPAAVEARMEEERPAWHESMRGQLFWFMRALGTIVD